MTSFVGIDAGGTHTVVLVGDAQQVVARVVGGPGAVRPGRALATATRIADTARKALTEARLLQADVLVVGAAGAGRDPERTELREALRNERLAERVRVTGDLDLALEAAFGTGPGMVLISGTGSVAVGRTPAGEVHRRGGFGWQIGDEGSGFAIGRAGLIAVARAQEGRGPPTKLDPALIAASPAQNVDELVRWSIGADPAEVAVLARVVFQLAEAGDPTARTIVAEAADELVGLAQSLLAGFGPRAKVPLALAGGNLAPGRGLREPVLERIRRIPRLITREEPVEPAQGALAMARRLV